MAEGGSGVSLIASRAGQIAGDHTEDLGSISKTFASKSLEVVPAPVPRVVPADEDVVPAPVPRVVPADEDVVPAPVPRVVRGNDDVNCFAGYNLKAVFGIIGLVFLGLIAYVIYLAVNSHIPETVPTDAVIRPDCFPDIGQNLSLDLSRECKERGCTWDPDARASVRCYFPDGWTNYRIHRPASRLPDGCTYRMELARNQSVHNGFPKNAEFVIVTIIGVDNDIVRIHIDEGSTSSTDGHLIWTQERWEPPIPFQDDGCIPDYDPNYEIKFPGETQVIVKRKGTGSILFQVDFSTLLFADQFIQLETKVPTNSLYGLGQVRKPHRKSLPNREKMLFLNRASNPTSHPFYLMIEEAGGAAHGVLLVNSNPMEIMLPTSSSISYRTIGGILDFFVFTGPSPVAVMRQKAKVAGLPAMPPYWSLGFQMGSSGYSDLEDIISMYDRNTRAGIPVDVQWLGAEVQKDFHSFTVDERNFGHQHQMIDFLNAISANGTKIAIVMDAAIAVDPAVPGYQSGLEMGVFVKDETGEKELITGCRLSPSHIIDFTHNKASDWLSRCLTSYQSLLPSFDGISIIMNEPEVTFYDGKWRGCVNNSLDVPPYSPMWPDRMEQKTICMSSRHAASSHYNVHNVYSFYSAKVVSEAEEQRQPGKRAFILSESATTGSGSFAGLWLWDLSSTWIDMRNSVPGILDSNLFGVPMVGASICGFEETPSEDLCARWMSLAAFYPLTTSHNAKGVPKQDPASMGPLVLESALNALTLRYTLLPYLYSLFYNASQFGDPVIRSLGFNFPSDSKAQGIEKQFMWGNGLLITPVLDEARDYVTAYIPEGDWFNFRDGDRLREGQTATPMNLYLNQTEISVLMRGGTIIPTLQYLSVTSDQRNMPFTIVVALDHKSEASGFLFWDDGASRISNDSHTLVDFEFREKQLSSLPRRVRSGEDGRIESIKLIGVTERVVYVIVKVADAERHDVPFSRSGETIHVTGMDLRLDTAFTLWITYPEDKVNVPLVNTSSPMTI